MIDRERFLREREGYEEFWMQPITIQFGAVFEQLISSREMLYGYGVVTDIKTPEAGQSFKAAALGRETDADGNPFPDSIIGGGDAHQSMIIRMTGEILTVDQYINAMRNGYLGDSQDYEEELQNFRTTLEEWEAKGSRVLPGAKKADLGKIYNYLYFWE